MTVGTIAQIGVFSGDHARHPLGVADVWTKPDAPTRMESEMIARAQAGADTIILRLTGTPKGQTYVPWQWWSILDPVWKSPEWADVLRVFKPRFPNVRVLTYACFPADVSGNTQKPSMMQPPLLRDPAWVNRWEAEYGPAYAMGFDGFHFDSSSDRPGEFQWAAQEARAHGRLHLGEAAPVDSFGFLDHRYRWCVWTVDDTFAPCRLGEAVNVPPGMTVIWIAGKVYDPKTGTFGRRHTLEDCRGMKRLGYAIGYSLDDLELLRGIAAL